MYNYCKEVAAVSHDVITVTDAMTALPKRAPDTHKYNYGRVLIIAGSVGYTGAPTLAAKAAYRTGAGVVTLLVPEAIYTVEAVKNDEAIVIPAPSTDGHFAPTALRTILTHLARADVCLIGPGLGISEDTFNIVYEVIRQARVPLIVDADGITAIARHINILDGADCPIILTPHAGEFSRLWPDAPADRVTAAREFALDYGVTLVLKGHRTVTAAPDGTCYLNTTGNPGMAKGGSGDVLAGMTAALAAQLGDPTRAAYTAAYLHGLAGDECAKRFGEYSLTPSDIIDAIKIMTR